MRKKAVKGNRSRQRQRATGTPIRDWPMIPLRVPPDLFKWLDDEATEQSKSRNMFILENLSLLRERRESQRKPMQAARHEMEGIASVMMLGLLEMLRQIRHEEPEAFEAYMSGQSDEGLRQVMMDRMSGKSSDTKASE